MYIYEKSVPIKQRKWRLPGAPSGPTDTQVSWILKQRRSCLVLLGGEQVDVDVGEDTTAGDGSAAHESVELLVVADGELKMTGNDPCLLVVAGSVSCELENLSCKVFHYSGEVDWGTGSNALTIVSFAEKTMDTSYWELKSSPAGSGLGLALCLTAFTSSRHVLLLLCVRTEIVSNASVSAYI